MKTLLYNKGLFILAVLLLFQMSCSPYYTLFKYKYADYNDLYTKGQDELMKSLVFSAHNDIIYERVLNTERDYKRIELSDRKNVEITKRIKYKDRIVIPKGTKGVYYEDYEEYGEWSKERPKDRQVNVTIWIDFGDSIIVPFQQIYHEYSSIPGKPYESMEDVDKYNLSRCREKEFSASSILRFPYDCDDENCIVYDKKRGGEVIRVLNWGKNKLVHKDIEVEEVNEKKARGKTDHNYE